MELEYLTSLGFSIIATEPILLHHPEDPPPEPAEASLAFAEAEDRGGRADTPPVPPKVHRRGAEDGGSASSEAPTRSCCAAKRTWKMLSRNWRTFRYPVAI
ncbi:unnamed protein product [Durusdinium trenchii]|uniref:Uncharacterized protein n=1 Tax=Durusdinium trenchii TaxID=1381693 RepID=A0ABP0HW27_9DINO